MTFLCSLSLFFLRAVYFNNNVIKHIKIKDVAFKPVKFASWRNKQLCFNIFKSDDSQRAQQGDKDNKKKSEKNGEEEEEEEEERNKNAKRFLSVRLQCKYHITEQI